MTESALIQFLRPTFFLFAILAVCAYVRLSQTDKRVSQPLPNQVLRVPVSHR